MKNLSLFIALSFAAAVHATDGTPIHETRPLKADGRITVSNVSGRIEVKAWGKNEVEITGTLGAGSTRLDIGGGPDNLRVEVVLPKRGRDVEGSDLFLRVPEGARVELESVSADLSLGGTRGAARLSSVSGDVFVDGAMRELRAQSVSGDLRIAALSADTRLESVSGEITAEKLSGVLRLETVSGDATASGGPFSEVDAETVSGDLELKLDSLADDADVGADSVSGNIRLLLPKALNAQLRLETFSGELRSDYGAPDRDEPERISATLGKGQGRIHVDSHSGDITVKGR